MPGFSGMDESPYTQVRTGTLIHGSFPKQGIEQPAHLGSQSSPPVSYEAGGNIPNPPKLNDWAGKPGDTK